MPTLRAPPHANYHVGRHRYGASADGFITDVHPDDVGALLAAGCIATDPWSAPQLREPPPPEPVRPEPPRVQLKGKPHMVYAPESGSLVRYTADAAGLFDAREEHVKALLRAGCERVVT